MRFLSIIVDHSKLQLKNGGLRAIISESPKTVLLKNQTRFEDYT
jgi:hypothetical protein